MKEKQMEIRISVISWRRHVTAAFLSILATTAISASASNPTWTSMGGLPGVAGSVGEPGLLLGVQPIAVDNAGNLYVGGQFTAVDNVFATNLAVWNGTNWSQVGSGVSGLGYGYGVAGTDYGGVTGMLYADGSLYIMGDITSVDGVAVTNLAKWDGTNWSSLGETPQPERDGLAVSGSTVYACGWFTNSDGSQDYIRKWDGTNWTSISTGFDNGVVGMTVFNNELYAAGFFTHAGNTNVKYIAKWDGTNWYPVGNNVDYGAYNFAVFQNSLYARGDFTNNDGSFFPLARWDGLNWVPVRDGLQSVSAMTAADTGLYVSGVVSGTNFLARWDGAQWTFLSYDMSASADAIAVYGTNIYVAGGWSGFVVGGNFVTGGLGDSGIAKWNGNQWQALGSGLNNPVLSVAAAGTNVVVGGTFINAGNRLTRYVAQWDGNAWAPMGSGMDSTVRAVTFWKTNLYAAGDFTHAGGHPANYIAKWTGADWESLASGTPTNVVALVASNNLYAGGSFGVAQWDGATWTTLGTIPSWVTALLVSGTNLYCAYDGFDNNVAQWNGFQWVKLGTGGFGPSILSIAEFNGKIYAAGYTRDTRTGDYYYLASWDGANWTIQSGPNGGEYLALAASGGKLYIAASSVNSYWIQTLDGSFYSSFSSRPLAMAFSSGHLYVGGDFVLSDDKVSAFIARADLRPNLSASRNGGTVTVSWDDPSFFLQKSAGVTGPYLDLPSASSPYIYDTTGTAQQYFRLRQKQ